MKLTLRKANALQNAILEQIKSIEVNASISVNEFQNVSDTITNAREQLVANDLRRDSLLQALYQIRAQVSAYNENSGVSKRLTRAAYLDKRMTQLKALAESTVAEDRAVINGKLDKIRNRPAESRASFYSGDEVTTGLLTQEQVSGYKAQILSLKKEKQKLNDEVLELNVRTEFELSNDVEAILVKESLV